MIWVDGYYASRNGQPSVYMQQMLKDPVYMQKLRDGAQKEQERIQRAQRQIDCDVALFVTKAIKTLRRSNALGINERKSGVREAYARYISPKQGHYPPYLLFDEVVRKMERARQIVVNKSERRGDMLYLSDELPKSMRCAKRKRKCVTVDRVIERILTAQT